MLTPAYLNVASFFYPIGNTPAVSLTQDLPHDQAADILLLGCGDVRNILFTAYSDYSFNTRRLDITCCDVERAILARNIILFTLLVDDIKGLNNTSIWDIYYHLRLDSSSIELLHAQSKKLHTLAVSMDSWHQSKYGSLLRFCDQGTLEKVREMWSRYITSDLTHDEMMAYDKRFKDSLRMAVDKRNKRIGEYDNLTSFRSAAPLSNTSFGDLPQINYHFWYQGITDTSPEMLYKQRHSNPMFASLITDTFTLHYGTEPLLGFHIATAYAPLTPESPLGLTPPISSTYKLVEAARVEFEAWSETFRRRTSQNLTMRFFAGDAIAFSHTLQHKRVVREDASAHWYRAPHHMEPLVLDGPDYGRDGKAPLSFNVIDTSNVADHVGAINLLVAASPLLENSISATLYIETLVNLAHDDKTWLDELMCGHLPTVSILLGLFPVEYWTNAASISTVEDVILDRITTAMGRESIVRQMRHRLIWKRPVSGSHKIPQTAVCLQIEEIDLATVLHQIYRKMFRNEDLIELMQNVDLLTLQKNSCPVYHRGSFASFLRLAKANVKADWSKVMDHLLNLIQCDNTILMGKNCIQELYLMLHLLDVHHMPSFLPSFYRNGYGRGSISLRAWKNIPVVVCITLKVPRDKLGVFTSNSPNETSTPIFHVVVQSANPSTPKSWYNIFAVVQLAFGTITTTGSRNRDDFRIFVEEDESGLAGSSALLISFYAPTWVALQEPQTTIIALTVRTTPQTSEAYMGILGPTMSVYHTKLVDEDHVYVTKYRPNQSGYPSICGYMVGNGEAKEPSNSATGTTITARIDRDTSQMVSFAGRIGFRTEDLTSIIRDQSPVVTIQISPCVIALVIGESRTQYPIHFPAPVRSSRTQLQISRDSSFVEVMTHVADPMRENRFAHFMYPVFQVGRTPVVWNMPHLTLERLPILDTKDAKGLKWLNTHAALQLSARERKLREVSILSGNVQKDVRVNFKDSLFSMLMRFCGIECEKARIFGLCDTIGGDVHIIFIVSCLRLDLGNHTVVLDSAVLPLTDELIPQLDPFFAGLSGAGPCNIRVNGDELKLWKEALPAYVERCRKWFHRTSCEYITKSRVPLSLEEGQPVLCSCGNGVLPPGFVCDIPGWKAFAKYAVRAAISPSFSVPYVEQIFDPKLLSNTNRCQRCGNDKAVNGNKLMACAKCLSVKYCSVQCQHADWKEHKNECAKRV